MALACENLPYLEQLEKMKALGYSVIQSGLWAETVPFAYFDTEGDIATTFEFFQSLFFTKNSRRRYS